VLLGTVMVSEQGLDDIEVDGRRYVKPIASILSAPPIPAPAASAPPIAAAMTAQPEAAVAIPPPASPVEATATPSAAEVGGESRPAGKVEPKTEGEPEAQPESPAAPDPATGKGKPGATGSKS
jgi:hypothetical protein